MDVVEQKISSQSLSLPQFSDRNDSLSAVVVKTVVFAAIGLLLMVANFFAEGLMSRADFQSVEKKVIFEGTNVWTPGDGILRMETKDVVTLLGDEPLFTTFKFDSGRLWGNFLQDDFLTTALYVGKVTILPFYASFDLQFDGETLKLAVYDGDVWVKFRAEDSEIDDFSPDFVNNLHVPKDTQVIVPMNKISEGLRSLLPSKLMKEFKYTVIPAADREDPWISANLEKDKEFAVEKKQEFVSEIIAKGASDTDGIFDGFFGWLGKNFTFIPAKREQMILDQSFIDLDNALFFATEGKSAESTKSLNKFLAVAEDLFSSDVTGDRAVEYLRRLLVFSPEDPQYEILRQFLQYWPVVRVRDEIFWRFVNQSTGIGAATAERTLDDYYQSIVARSDLEADYLVLQNQRFDNLLLKYPVFYKDAYFVMKAVLEERLLKVYEDGAMKDEVVQSLISSKIDFLKRLRKFFFDGEIEVAQAKEIFSRLVNEIDDLMPDGSAVAVLKLFESQLADVGDFWGYLTSPEYHTKVYGLTYRDRYEAYLAEREKIASFVDIQEDVLGEKVEEKDVVDVVKEIEGVFAGHADIRDLEVGKIESGDQRFVNVDGVIAGYPFKAVYDRATESVKDVQVFDEMISDRAVKLDNLLAILNERFADLAPEEGELVEEVTLESSAQRVARAFVAKKIGEYGFVVGMEDVQSLDESGGVYRLESLKFKGNDGARVTFDLVMSGEIATNILLYIDSRPASVDGEYKLEELAALILEGNFVAVPEPADEPVEEDIF